MYRTSKKVWLYLVLCLILSACSPPQTPGSEVCTGSNCSQEPSRDESEKHLSEPAQDIAPEPQDEAIQPDASEIEATPEKMPPEQQTEMTPELPPEVIVEQPVEQMPDKAPPTPKEGWLYIPIQAVRVSHDDGSLQASITPAQVQKWVIEANKIYAVAKIFFQYDPKKDFSDTKSTLLNQIDGHWFPNWKQAVAAGNKLAASFPGKVLALFRHGRSTHATGGGFSWTDYNFLVMPGFDKTYVCKHQNITLFAHELGHYFGLRHTFHEIYKTNAAAQNAWNKSNKNPAFFDGDGLTDTPPDVFTNEFQCAKGSSISLSGTSFTVPRQNIMSYHDSIQKTLTKEQIALMRQVALLRFGKKLTSLVKGSTSKVEGEDLAKGASGNGSFAPQRSMSRFHGKWSQNAQLWWSGVAKTGKLTLPFSMAKSGKYGVYGIFTRAPDFGIHQIRCNGQKGNPIGLYSKYVHHTAPLLLGTFTLQAQNQLEFLSINKHKDSKGYGFGLDLLLFKPVQP